MRIFLLQIVAVVAWCHLACNASAGTRKAILEFRLAVADATAGYSKHNVADSDDPIYVSDKTVLTGSDIEKVSFYKDAQGDPVVGFVLTDEGSKRLWAATSTNIGKKLAIMLDGKVVSAPRIMHGIRKEGSITGNFDDEDLLRFFCAIVLRQTPKGAKPRD